MKNMRTRQPLYQENDYLIESINQVVALGKREGFFVAAIKLNSAQYYSFERTCYSPYSFKLNTAFGLVDIIKSDDG